MILERDTAWFMNELVRGPKENRLNTNMSEVVFPSSFMYPMPEHRHICVSFLAVKQGLYHTVDFEGQQSTKEQVDNIFLLHMQSHDYSIY